MENKDIKMSEKYDNISELKTGKNENGFIENDSLAKFVERDNYYCYDVNKFVLNRHLTTNLTQLYYDKLQVKRINNHVRFNGIKKPF